MAKIKRVLFIDDDDISNFINIEVFSYIDFHGEISTYKNPKKALKYLLKDCTEEEYPDLIFLDIDMQVRDGYEFLDIYLSPTDKKTDVNHIVILTLLEPKDIAKEVANYGISQVISKPLTAQKLNDLMKSLNLD